MEQTYFIKRIYAKHPSEFIKGGLTLEEARDHCSDDETSSATCTSEEGLERTRKMGPWFDGYDAE